MTKTFLFSSLADSAILAGVAFSQTVETLRGASVTDAVAVEEVFRQQETRFSRNCRQPPPLIPHSIEQ